MTSPEVWNHRKRSKKMDNNNHHHDSKRTRQEAMFTKLIGQFRGFLCDICIRHFPLQPQLQKELYSDITVKLWRYVDILLPPEDLPSRLEEEERYFDSRRNMVVSVARSCAVDLYRRNKRQERVLLSDQMEHVAVPDDEREEQKALLYSVVEGLPPDDRFLFTLWLDRCTYEEMADITGMSRASVYRSILRIKDKVIKQAIKKNEQ